MLISGRLRWMSGIRDHREYRLYSVLTLIRLTYVQAAISYIEFIVSQPSMAIYGNLRNLITSYDQCLEYATTG